MPFGTVPCPKCAPTEIIYLALHRMPGTRRPPLNEAARRRAENTADGPMVETGEGIEVGVSVELGDALLITPSVSFGLSRPAQ